MSGGLGHKRARRALRSAVPKSTHPPQVARPEERLPLRELRPDIRRTIAVGGAASNAGKTWLCERILETLGKHGLRTLALKVTRTHLGACPRLEEACGVCDSLAEPWRLISEREELDVPRKDTGRYLGAGADLVLWLLVQPRHLREGLLAALAEVPPGVVLVAEGNSFLDFTIPDLAVMAVSEGEPLKPSARPLVGRIDAVAGSPAARDRFIREHPYKEKQPALLEPDSVASFILTRIGIVGGQPALTSRQALE